MGLKLQLIYIIIFIYGMYIAPLQGRSNYSEALPAQAGQKGRS